MTTYAQAGVDYRKISPFKKIMKEICEKTASFPLRRNVLVISAAHGVRVEYLGKQPHAWLMVQEGLGNLNWIAEWMDQYSHWYRSFYDVIGINNALTAVNDLVAHGAMPVAYTDMVEAGDSEWFENEDRARALAMGYYHACEQELMALGGGESGALRYLVRAEDSVKSAPVLSGTALGIIAPSTRWISADTINPFDRIIGVTSSGLHANGSSLVIKLGLTLPDQFLTKVPNGNTLGEEALIPTRSYVKLVEELLNNDVKIHRIVPGTGGGVSKLATHPENVMYRIYDWPKNIPLLFPFLREQFNLSLRVLLTIFNWGVGYYLIIPPHEVTRAIEIGTKAGYDLMEIGWVEESNKPHVYFESAGLALPPPGSLKLK